MHFIKQEPGTEFTQAREAAACLSSDSICNGSIWEIYSEDKKVSCYNAVQIF